MNEGQSSYSSLLKLIKKKSSTKIISNKRKHQPPGDVIESKQRKIENPINHTDLPDEDNEQVDEEIATSATTFNTHFSDSISELLEYPIAASHNKECWKAASSPHATDLNKQFLGNFTHHYLDEVSEPFVESFPKILDKKDDNGVVRPLSLTDFKVIDP